MARIYILLIFLVSSLFVAGCGSQAVAPASDNQAAADLVVAGELNLPRTVDVATVNELRSRSDVVLLDVREDWEFAGGHIPGAMWLPLAELPARLDEVPADKTVVAVCRSGNRSSQATNFLLQQGFENVHNMQGGMNAWGRAGYEIEK